MEQNIFSNVKLLHILYVGQLTMNAIQHSRSPQCLHRTEGGHLALTARDVVERSR